MKRFIPDRKKKKHELSNPSFLAKTRLSTIHLTVLIKVLIYMYIGIVPVGTRYGTLPVPYRTKVPGTVGVVLANNSRTSEPLTH